ncbi:Carboxy-cis,cis-muconate cyclase [Cytospora mali]|uniref:Carboxy-cis,cis-muconate cyclase n=1 Tax=Cytospora mali TaxID=578113 RepID=A0A194V0D2_CYTMA|nr:Carboxy-cis,cis-muconate cyclase [Valsa mali var. pyri (nom. inval.)]
MFLKAALFGLLPLAVATKHNLFVGGFDGAFVYSLEFDDETLSLDLVKNISSHSSHLWLALSHDKANLYGVEEGGWASYKVKNGTDVDYETSVASDGNCSTTRGIFIIAAEKPPYNVYADPFGNCANVVSVDETGTLDSNLQNISYYSGSGVHGMALDPAGDYIYAADDSGNAIWTYSIDNSTGLLTFVSAISAPTTGAAPRHAAVHPGGKYIYVILEESNELAQYKIDPSTHIPDFTNVTYSLLNPGQDSSTFWSDDAAVTPDGRILWATSRSRDDTANGTISAYSLSPDGAIESRIFLTNTTTTGGTANALSVPSWSNQYVALTDSSLGFVQIWTIENGTGKIVSEVLLVDGGCCANVAWVN